MPFDDSNHSSRKPYYVSVGARQVLADPHAAAYELEVLATEEEADRLIAMLEELDGVDNAQTFHFARHPYETPREGINDGYEMVITDIYKLLHELGTAETKAAIEHMELF